jgi:hypothetical protein
MAQDFMKFLLFALFELQAGVCPDSDSARRKEE